MAYVDSEHLHELRELLAHRVSGVRVIINRDSRRDNTVFIHLIEVPPTQRGYGLGDRVLNLICQTADARGWDLRLNPTDDLGSDFDRLVRWYAASGFVFNRSDGRMLREVTPVDHWAAA